MRSRPANDSAQSESTQFAGLAPVSAIVPVAARPALLSGALRSILEAEVLPAQLIVVLNAGGTERPMRAADRAAADAVFRDAADSGVELRLTECEEAGPGPARNAGVALARETWLAFLDSDDLWTPPKLARQMRFLNARPHLTAVHTAETWIKDGRTLAQPAHLRPRAGRCLRESMSHCLISCSSLVIRRDVFGELGGFDPAFRVCEDFELWLRLLARRPIGLVPEALTIKQSGDWPQESRRFHSLDALRIQAILKLARERSAALSPAELSAARQVCFTKLEILRRGAARHGSRARVAALAREVAGVFAKVPG
jgi:hypothetical protein